MRSIHIPADGPATLHQKHWQFCVGSGHALLALRTDYTRQLKFIRDELGIERVRFHGIFCDDMRTFNDLSMQVGGLPGTEAFEEYNFNAIGVAYDNVLEAGMKPFVELSFMPEKLAKKEEGRPLKGGFFYRPNIVPPADEDAWRDYLRAFLGFLIHRYGLEEIRQWFFEVWNEPDLPYVFWNGSREEYFRLYEITARVIRETDPLLKVGGPATSSSKWITSFRAFCEKNGVPLDFISTHQYAGDPLGGVEDQGDPEADNAGAGNGESWFETQMRLAEGLKDVKEKTFLNGYRVMSPDKSETSDLPDDLFRKNAARAKEQAGPYPLFYTEWNENAIFSAATNDTRKVAAYDVRAALDVAANVDGSSVWCFSDIFEELHPFPEEFHGGFGMLTQNGIPKPVFYAMKMLRDAGDERLILEKDATAGEIGYAAFRKGKDTQILLFRQKMKNLNLPKEEVEIRVSGMEKVSGLTLRRIDEEHGNPMKIWEEMGRPVQLNRAEIDQIREKSAVREENWPFEQENGEIVIRAALGVNDVWFLTLRGA